MSIRKLCCYLSQRKILFLLLSGFFLHQLPAADTATTILLNYYAPKISTLISSPERLLIGIQNEVDDVSPSPFFKRSMPVEWRQASRTKLDNISYNLLAGRMSVSTMIMPSFLPSMDANFAVKVQANKEGRLLPQFTLGGSYWQSIAPLIASSLISSDAIKRIMKNVKLRGFSLFITASKSLVDNFKVFGGYKYGRGGIYAKFAASDLLSFANIGSFGNILSGDINISSTYNTHELYAGINLLRTRSNSRLKYYKGIEVIVYLAYELLNDYVSLRSEINFGTVGITLGLQPDAVHLIDYTLGLRLRFTI